MTDFQTAKTLVRQLFADMEKAKPTGLNSAVSKYFSSDYRCYAVYPFNELSGITNVIDVIWQPLHKAFYNLQRREDIFMAGTNEVSGETWVMSMGHFLGNFDTDWLGIRANRKVATLRYAEFHCVENNAITQSGIFFDILGLMQYLGIQPLPVSTGQHFVYPGPIHHNGLLFDAQPAEQGKQTLDLVNRMIADLDELNKTANDNYSPDILAKTWHDDMSWYGPAGIGASFTIERYQQQHSYPFRQGLKGKQYNGHLCRFAEGSFACFFGWPNLTNTPTGGFLGLPGGEKSANMRIVDVYYRVGDKLKENWVFIDLPYWLKQQGLDVLKRTQQIMNP